MNWPANGLCTTGGGSVGRRVAHLDGTKAQHYRSGAGMFYRADDANANSLGSTYREMRIVRGAVDGYFESDGAAGDHNVLFGLSGGKLSGNTWLDGAGFAFNGNYALDIGESAHVAFFYDFRASLQSGFKTIGLKVNGILDAQFAIGGAGLRTAGSAKSQMIYFGCSDHSNPSFWALWFNVFDNDQIPYNNPWTANIPGRDHPITFGYARNAAGSADEFKYANLTWDFSLQDGTGIVPDVSPIGYLGRRSPGLAWNATPTLFTPQWASTPQDFSGLSFTFGDATPRVFSDIPYISGEPTVGDSKGQLVVPVKTFTPVAPPALPGYMGSTLKAWDSFQRQNQTYAFQDRLDIGAPEAGTLAGVPYVVKRAAYDTTSSQKPDVVGLLGGWLVNTDDVGFQLVTQDAGNTNHAVRAKRDLGSLNWIGGAAIIGLTCRYIDAANFIGLLHDPRPAPVGAGTSYTVFARVANALSIIGTGTVPVGYVTLSLKANGTNISVYFDDVLSQTFAGVTANAAGTRCGVAFGADGGPLFTTSGCRATNLLIGV